LSRSTYASQDYTATGAVPLAIYGQRIDPDRWNAVELSASAPCQHCGDDLRQICQDARSGGRSFTAIVPELSPYITSHRPDIAQRYEDGLKEIKTVVTHCGGKVFALGEFARLDDDCFVDFLHMNGEGARRLTDEFMAWQAGKQPADKVSFDCKPVAG
jgi:hypothetical protein